MDVQNGSYLKDVQDGRGREGKRGSRPLLDIKKTCIRETQNLSTDSSTNIKTRPRQSVPISGFRF